MLIKVKICGLSIGECQQNEYVFFLFKLLLINTMEEIYENGNFEFSKSWAKQYQTRPMINKRITYLIVGIN